MYFKALRATSVADLYKPPAAVLKTLYRDEKTHRVRDIKSGDDVLSIYVHVTGPGTGFIYSKAPGLASDFKKVGGQHVSAIEEVTPPRQLWYNEADMLENQVSFPEELLGDEINPLAIGKIEPLRIWEDEGFSLKKFVTNKMSDSESDSDYDTEPESGSSDESAKDYGSDDLGSNWNDIDEEEERSGNEPGCSREKLSEELKILMRKVFNRMRNEPERDPVDPKVMHEDFMTLLDMEKARSESSKYDAKYS